MNRSSTHNECTTVIPASDDRWPRDFDFRETYAEQRELLEPLAPCRQTLPHAQGAERND
ncbi:hypothetical protein [Pseudomonas benzenivorans]|uniref:hypothetical protein n=1 Tax=Pseudomonas benzenivorans TaxID=556533 RepID=UPI0035121195